MFPTYNGQVQWLMISVTCWFALLAVNLHSLTGGIIHQCCIQHDKQCDFCNVCDRSQKSSAPLCEGTGGGLPCGSRNSCSRQSSDAVLEPFLEDALPLVPKTQTAWKKMEKKADGFKSEQWKEPKFRVPLGITWQPTTYRTIFPDFSHVLYCLRTPFWHIP